MKAKVNYNLNGDENPDRQISALPKVGHEFERSLSRGQHMYMCELLTTLVPQEHPDGIRCCSPESLRNPEKLR